MFKSAEVILCAALLLILAGCATSSPDQNSAGTSVVIVTNVVTTITTNHISRPLPAAVTNQPPVIHTNAIPAKIARPAPILIWTSLNRWTAQQKLSAPRQISASPVAAYNVSSPLGTLTLTIGSHEAMWNGVGVYLGFTPEIIDNQIFVYGLDLQKNIEPLLVGEPLKFGTNRIIVIDPGHGGINGGTISVLDQRPEKDFTLDLAKRLKPLLETNGWHVFLTHTNDVDVSLSNRVVFAELHHADLFISLHFNSSAPDHKQSGVETYCVTPVGMPSTLTRGNVDLWSQAFPNNEYDDGNIQLAVRLHSAFLRASGEQDRGVRRERFMGVLHGQRRPAILIEGGYLSNPREAAKIENPAFRQHVAEALANALRGLEQ